MPIESALRRLPSAQCPVPNAAEKGRKARFIIAVDINIKFNQNAVRF